MVRAVIFDMDGVIVDTEVIYKDILGKFWKHCGFPLGEEELLSTVGSNGRRTYREIISRLEPSCPWDFDTYIANQRTFSKPLLDAVRYKDLLNPGVKETLKQLMAEGFQLALASSSSRTNILRVLTECDIHRCFSQILSGDDFKESKPDPEIYLTMAEKLGLSPKECAAIEDSPLGIESALKAGMTVIAKKDGRLPLDQSRAHCHVESIPEILPLLRGMK